MLENCTLLLMDPQTRYIPQAPKYISVCITALFFSYLFPNNFYIQSSKTLTGMGNERKYREKKKEHQEQGLVKQNQYSKKNRWKLRLWKHSLRFFLSVLIYVQKFLIFKKIISPIQPNKKDAFLQSKIKPPFANRNNK